MGLNIGGYNDEPNWPKMGPSLLIATALILAIRTARWIVSPNRASCAGISVSHGGAQNGNGRTRSCRASFSPLGTQAKGCFGARIPAPSKCHVLASG